MILNVSKYTDIPMLYSNWFYDKISKGIFCIEKDQANNIYKLNPQNFEFIVFQTKNPKEFIKDINLLDDKGFKYIFLFTLTPYKEDIEKNIGNKHDILNTFKKLSKTIGSNRVVWKYGPIIINQTYDIDYHKKSFEQLCRALQGHTNECLVSFIENYEMPLHANLYISSINKDTKEEIVVELKKIANKYNIDLYSNEHFSQELSINNSSKLLKKKIYEQYNKVPQNLKSVDIGIFNTCIGNCEYCSCGGNNRTITSKRYKSSFVDSPLLIGKIDKTLEIKHPKTPSVFEI